MTNNIVNYKTLQNIVTMSSLSTFNNCPRKYKFIYIDNLVPIKTQEYFIVGSVVHHILENIHSPDSKHINYFSNKGLKIKNVDNVNLKIDGLSSLQADLQKEVLKYAKKHKHLILYGLEVQYKNICSNIINYIDLYIKQEGVDLLLSKETIIKIKVMIEEYCNQTTLKTFHSVEQTFKCKIRNIITGKNFKYNLWGKIDGIILSGNDCFILDHKTTSLGLPLSYEIDLNYDFNFQSYCYYYLLKNQSDKHLQFNNIEGVIFNFLRKSKLKMKQDENEYEFKLRSEKIASKNKSGITKTKQKKGETESEFITRLKSQYKTEPMFSKQIYYYNDSKYQEFLEHLHMLCTNLNYCRKTQHYPRKISMCNSFDCLYFNKCYGNEFTTQHEYEFKQPHLELKG